MKDWFCLNVILAFWIWYGNKIVGFEELTLHTNKGKVIGITFGKYKEAV